MNCKNIVLCMCLAGMSLSLYAMEERADASSNSVTQVPEYIQQAIDRSSVTGRVKELLELREPAENSPYKTLLDGVIIECIGQLRPSLTLLAARKVADVLIKENKTEIKESIERLHVLEELRHEIGKIVDISVQLKQRLNKLINGIYQYHDENWVTLLHYHIHNNDLAACRKLLRLGGDRAISSILLQEQYIMPLNYAQERSNSITHALLKNNATGWVRPAARLAEHVDPPDKKRLNLLGLLLKEVKESTDIDIDTPLDNLTWLFYECMVQENSKLIPDLQNSLKIISVLPSICEKIINLATLYCTNLAFILSLMDGFLGYKKQDATQRLNKVFVSAIRAGNVFIVRQCLMRGALLEILEDDHDWYMKKIVKGNRINKELFPLLIAAGLSIEEFILFLNNYESATKDDLVPLEQAKKLPYHNESITVENTEELTLFEAALVEYSVHLNFGVIHFLIQDAEKQRINIKSHLLTHLIKDGDTSLLTETLYQIIETNIEISLVDDTAIRCIQKFLEWDPSLKTYIKNGKTLLMLIYENERWASNQQLIQLFSE